jgi:hypothetical protein
MRFTSVLFAVALGSCTGSIDQAEAPDPVNEAAVLCYRSLKGTDLPHTFKECESRGWVDKGGVKPRCQFRSRDRKDYEQCMVAGGFMPWPEPGLGEGSVSCTVIYEEDDSCQMEPERLVP